MTAADMAVIQLLLESQATAERKEILVPLPPSVCPLPSPLAPDAKGARGQGEPG